MSDHEATAKALLPCNCDAGNVPIWAPHQDYCISQYWPAVAAALVKAEGTWLTDCHIAEATVYEKDAEIAQLKAQVAELHERSDARDDAIEQEGFVRGLERARRIVGEHDDDGECKDAIAAEIAKAGA